MDRIDYGVMVTGMGRAKIVAAECILLLVLDLAKSTAFTYCKIKRSCDNKKGCIGSAPIKDAIRMPPAQQMSPLVCAWGIEPPASQT
jgi:hypothetical protein